LTHPGTPCIFYDHLWTDGILKLLKLRRRAGLHCDSQVQAATFLCQG
jgi:hypothetical protein